MVLRFLKEVFALNSNIKYRLKFSKLGRLRFIGHLDLLALVQRCIKMSMLPIAYSNGFHPHQIMSFALPLSLGMGSMGDYLDIELKNHIDTVEIINKLNYLAPEGFKILKARKLKQEEKNAASIIQAGIYEVTLPKDSLISNKNIEEMLAKQEIVVLKKSKKKEVEVNIRKHIYKCNLELNENNQKVITLLIASGSKENLKPDLVINYLYEVVGQVYNAYKIYYLRKDLLKVHNNNFISIMEVSD